MASVTFVCIFLYQAIFPMQRFFKLAFLSTVIALAGCAANVQRQSGGEQNFSVSKAAAKQLSLDVQGNEQMAASSDWQQFREAWKTGMAEAAGAAGIALVPKAAEPAPTAPPSTQVVVKINDYRYITRGARVAAGIMTGNAYIDADVSFIEMPAGTVLGTRKYSTSSSAWQGVFAPMTESQIRGISDEIVKEVAQR